MSERGLVETILEQMDNVEKHRKAVINVKRLYRAYAGLSGDDIGDPSGTAGSDLTELGVYLNIDFNEFIEAGDDNEKISKLLFPVE